MAPRYYKKLAILAKLEETYGTDPTPTGTANAMLMVNVILTPLAGEEVTRDLMLPYLGHQGVLLTGTYVELQGEIESAGAGAAGDAPAYGVLLQACGMAETLTADTDAVYTPVALGENPSVAIYVNLDGVNHVMLGVRGTMTLTLTPKQIPRFRFTLRGMLGPIADAVLPSVTLTGFQAPLPVSKENTPVLTLHGISAPVESLSIDIGNDVQLRDLINHRSIEIVDRRSTGSIVMQAAALATKNWFAVAQARTRGALAAQHGTLAGNIVAVAAPYVEIGRPTYGQTQNINNKTMPLMLCTGTGNDEWSFTVK